MMCLFLRSKMMSKKSHTLVLSAGSNAGTCTQNILNVSGAMEGDVTVKRDAIRYVDLERSRRNVVCRILALAALATALAAPCAIAQTKQWTWMSGRKYDSASGVYGSQGLADPSNTPGARCFSASWRDGNGDLWLFGGGDISLMSTSARFNDLWKYDLSTGQWTWMKGSDRTGQPGVYGIKGMAAPENTPGYRYGVVSWTDSDGNLWLFGGSKGGTFVRAYNDLWKFDVVTNNWMWVRGASETNEGGNYGALGLAGSANMPGARYNAVSWTDSEGNLWLFGGSGYDGEDDYGELNDLWKYTPETNTWIWMKGDFRGDRQGTYGTQGVEDPANTPGARRNAVSWTDPSGNLWVFGGESSYKSYYSDLWKYDPATNNWTWMKGPSRTDQRGIYGALGVEDPNNTPGSRKGATGSVDALGQLYLFGGHGRDSASREEYLNDLWRYDPVTGNWTWLSGSSVEHELGTYGMLGIAYPENRPGGRLGALSWMDATDGFWFFGGFGYDSSGSIGPSWSELNDFWCYDLVQEGFLQVTIEPDDAVARGAQWQFAIQAVGHNSGSTIPFRYGDRTIEFRDGLGWIAPASQMATIVEGELTEITVTYAGPYSYQVDFQTDATPGALLVGDTPQTIPHSGDCSQAKAIPPAGYHFTKWMYDGMDYSTSNPLTVENVTEPMTLTAVFVSDVLYVDDDAPNDPSPYDASVSDPCEDGTHDCPFDSIQEAIDLGANGVMIQVAPGRYYEHLTLNNGGIHLNGLAQDPDGMAELPIIDGYGSDTVVTITGVRDAGCIISGFVLTGGYGDTAGGIACDRSNVVVEHCLIVGNRFYRRHNFGGTVNLNQSTGVFVNCTLAGNTGTADGSAIFLMLSDAELKNCILWNDGIEAISGLTSTYSVDITYSTINGGWTGQGNLSDDPLFVAPGYWTDQEVWIDGDYHLMSQTGRWDLATAVWVADGDTSPAIDAGHPSNDWDNEPQPNGGRINQGAFGGTNQASKASQ